MLAGILSTTVVLPFVLGVALGLISLARPTRRNAIVPLLFIAFALALFLVLEGIPTFQSIGMKQKLPLIMVAIGLVAAAGLTAGARQKAAAAWLIAVLSLAGVLWLGQNILLTSPAKVILALLNALAAIASAFSRDTAQTDAQRNAKAEFLPAAFSAAFGLSLAAAFGAFLGAAQLNGAMAALLGGATLTLFIAYAFGKDGVFGFDRLTLMAVAAVVTQFVSVAILLTPKLSLAGAALAILCWLVPLAVARLAMNLARFGRLMRFLIGAILTFLPAAASIAVSASFALH